MNRAKEQLAAKCKPLKIDAAKSGIEKKRSSRSGTGVTVEEGK
jgi:hypothetical protein